jgi:hypothetical protein
MEETILHLTASQKKFFEKELNKSDEVRSLVNKMNEEQRIKFRSVIIAEKKECLVDGYSFIPGDVVAFERLKGIYWHIGTRGQNELKYQAIVIFTTEKDFQMIHLWDRKNKKNSSIMISSLKEVKDGRIVRRSRPHADKVTLILAKAFLDLGNLVNYNAAFENCEHWVTEKCGEVINELHIF